MLVLGWLAITSDGPRLWLDGLVALNAEAALHERTSCSMPRGMAVGTDLPRPLTSVEGPTQGRMTGIVADAQAMSCALSKSPSLLPRRHE